MAEPNGQRSRLALRRPDRVRQWERSPSDVATLGRWDARTQAVSGIVVATETPLTAWTVVTGNHQQRGQVEAARFLLHWFPYDDEDTGVVDITDPPVIGPAPAVGGLGERPLPGASAA